MPQLVVDGLEFVEIDERHPNRFLSPAAFFLLIIHEVPALAPIEKIGKAVMTGLFGKHLVGFGQEGVGLERDFSFSSSSLCFKST